MSITLVADNFSPILQGDTLVNFTPQFAQYVNGVLQAFDLTGLTISLRMQDPSSFSSAKNGLGTWTVDNAVAGQAHYAWNSADVSVPGSWILFIKLTNNSTGAFVHSFVKTLEIVAVP